MLPERFLFELIFEFDENIDEVECSFPSSEVPFDDDGARTGDRVLEVGEASFGLDG